MRWIRIRTTHQALKCGTQMQTRTPARGYLLRDRQGAQLVQDCSLAIWTCHQATSSTLRKPAHTYDVNLVARLTTKWSGSTSAQRSGDHFMNASMKAAVHVGTDYEAIVRVTRTPEFSEIRPSLSLTLKEVVDQQNEIFETFTIDSDEIP